MSNENNEMAKISAIMGKTNRRDFIHALVKPSNAMVLRRATDSKMRVSGSRAIKTAPMAIRPRASFVLGSRRCNLCLPFLNFVCH